MSGDRPTEYQPRPFGKKLFITIIIGCVVAVGVVLSPLTGMVPVFPPINRLYGLDVSVTPPTLNGGVISGAFKLYPKLFGMQSNGTGGACLITDVSSLVTPSKASDIGIHKGNCTSDAQCEPNCATDPICSNNPAATGPTQKWVGYCVPESGNQAGRCWYKPSNSDLEEQQLCEKSAYHPNLKGSPTPWPVGVNNPMPNTPGFDVNAFYQNHTGGKPARWLLVGRVNSFLGGYWLRYGDPACLSLPPGQPCK